MVFRIFEVKQFGLKHWEHTRPAYPSEWIFKSWKTLRGHQDLCLLFEKWLCGGKAGESGIWFLSTVLSSLGKERALQGTQVAIKGSCQDWECPSDVKRTKASLAVSIWVTVALWVGQRPDKYPPQRPPPPSKSNAFLSSKLESYSSQILWTLLEPWNVPASLSLGVNKLRMFATHGESSFPFCLSSNCLMQASYFTPSVVHLAISLGFNTWKSHSQAKVSLKKPS